MCCGDKHTINKRTQKISLYWRVLHQKQRQGSVGVMVGRSFKMALWPKGCKLESLIPRCSTGAAQQLHDKPVANAPGSSRLIYAYLTLFYCL